MSNRLEKVFFDPGYLPTDEVVKLVHNHPCLKLIRHRKKDLPTYRKQGLDIQTYPEYKNERMERVLENDIEKVWSVIINDHQTSVLFDRTTKSDSEVFKFNDLFLMCCAYQNWLEKEKPDMLLYTATPHNIKTWVLSRVAESIGIPVRYFQVSFFPWRQFLIEGLRKDGKLIPPSVRTPSEQDVNFYNDYIKKKQGTLEEAMPSYEINRLKKNNWKLLKPKSEIKNFFKKPLSSIAKIQSYLTYEKLSQEVGDKKYVAFFLHYQPERSTIPEGYGFGIQFSAILALQQSLPSDTYLVVREHPSTYTLSFSRNYRSKAFYEMIASIDRVIISPISADPYHLIDNSIATAAITGTVIGEALVRGKPSIAFGAGPMQAIDTLGFHRFCSIENLRKFLATLDKPGQHDCARYFENVCASSFSGAESSSVKYDDNLRARYLINSAINGINQLLSREQRVHD